MSNVIYTLNATNGHVRYALKQKSGTITGETTLDAAKWMLDENKPFRTIEMDGYAIGVDVNGARFFFDGEWGD